MEQRRRARASGNAVTAVTLGAATRNNCDRSRCIHLENSVLVERRNVDVSGGIERDPVRVIQVCVYSGNSVRTSANCGRDYILCLGAEGQQASYQKWVHQTVEAAH